MFSLRDYILKLLDGSIGNEPDYKVREIALGWYDKGVLVQADLAALDSLIEAQYKEEAVEEEVEEAVIEEATEEVIEETNETVIEEPIEETEDEENV